MLKLYLIVKALETIKNFITFLLFFTVILFRSCQAVDEVVLEHYEDPALAGYQPALYNRCIRRLLHIRIVSQWALVVVCSLCYANYLFNHWDDIKDSLN